MQIRRFHRSITVPASVGLAGLLVISSLSVPGCGSSESDKPPAVSPPTSSADSLQMPESDVNPDIGESTDPSLQPGTGAFEMPDDSAPDSQPERQPADPGFTLPDDSNSSNAVPPTSGVRYATWDEIQRRVSQTGQITVVDLWSLSCEPCLKEFPELVRLYQESGDSIQCVAVNLDFDGRKTRPPQHYESQVNQFLDSVDADMLPTYICSTPSDDVYAAADIDSIPTVMVYGTDGKPVKVFVDAGETLGFTYQDDVLPLLEKLAG